MHASSPSHPSRTFRAAIAAVAAVMALPAVAATSYWLTPGGGDLADTGNWTADVSPYWAEGSTDIGWLRPISPSTAPFVFFAASDLVFNEIRIHENEASTQQYTFDPGAGRTILFNGGPQSALFIGGNNGKKAVVRFESGTYKLRDNASGNNKKLRLLSQNGGMTGILDGPDTRVELDVEVNGYLGNALVVTNGAYLKGAIKIGGSGEKLHDGLFLVSGTDPVLGTPTVFDAKERTLAFDADNSGGEFTMLVNDGAVVTNFFGRWGARGSNARLVVDNASVYGHESATDDTIIGNNTDANPTNNSVTVRNRGVFKTSLNRDLVIGRAGSGNAVAVEENGRLYAKVVNVGNTSGNHLEGNFSNRLSVASGGYLNASAIASKAASFGNEIDIGGAATLVEVTGNGGIEIASSNTVVRVHDGAAVSNLNSSATLALLGGGSRFEILSGAEFYAGNGVQQARKPDVFGTTLLIEGGTLRIPSSKSFEIGGTNDWASIDTTPRNNTIRVGDGGLLETHRLRFYGYGNALVVSNGTVQVNGEFHSGYHRSDETCGNTRLVFSGDCPQLLVKGNAFDIARGTELHFDIPETGYAAPPVFHDYPSGTRNLYFRNDDNTITVNAEAYAKRGGGRQTLVKANLSAGYKINASAAQMTAFNAGLPAGYRIELVENDTELVLVVPNSAKATVIVLR